MDLGMVTGLRPQEYDRYASTNQVHSMNIYLAMGTTCNLDCHYCPQEVHDGKQPWHDFEKLLHLIKQICHQYRWKKYRTYNLLGGEPSLMPRLPELCARIKEIDSGARILLGTNGTRTPKFWAKIAPHLDQVLCSVHVRQIDITRLNEGFKNLIEQGVHVAANVLMDVNHWQKAVDTAHWLEQQGWCHYITMKPVETMLGSNELQDYSAEQRTVIQQWGKERQYARFNACCDLHGSPALVQEDIYRWCRSDGSHIELNNFQAVSRDWDKLSGWHCFISADKLSVQTSGKVAAGDTCDQIKVLGNFYQSDPSTWQWTMESTICKRERCVCGGDLDTHKFKHESDAQNYAQLIRDRLDQTLLDSPAL